MAEPRWPVEVISTLVSSTLRWSDPRTCSSSARCVRVDATDPVTIHGPRGLEPMRSGNSNGTTEAEQAAGTKSGSRVIHERSDAGRPADAGSERPPVP
jgi:hypothetical protein